jgi:hypothetical protein
MQIKVIEEQKPTHDIKTRFTIVGCRPVNIWMLMHRNRNICIVSYVIVEKKTYF